MIQKIISHLAETKYIREVLAHPVDLSEFRKHRSPRLVIGLTMIGFSYIISWPAVFALTVLAGWLRQPLIAIIGCPITYGFSHVVFLVGAMLARVPLYMTLFIRYAVWALFRKLLPDRPRSAECPVSQAKEPET
jgi:hypothetical protein